MRTREEASYWRSVSCALVFLLIGDLVPRVTAIGDKDSTVLSEYCRLETFNVSCGHNEVLIIRSAFYGRMRRSRCIKDPFPFIGCVAEVSKIVGARCTGRRNCSFMVPNDGLQDIHPCPGILGSYLEVSHKCVRDPTQNAVVEWSTYVYQTASVNGSKILYCNIPYTGETDDSEHILTWRKQKVPILIEFGGYSPHIDEEYRGRLRLVEKAAIELKNILPSDEGWYECSIIIVESRSDPNSTWIYLSVHSQTYEEGIRFSVSGHSGTPMSLVALFACSISVIVVRFL